MTRDDAGNRDRRRERELLAGTLDMLILRTLGSGSEHGYGIARAIEHDSGESLRIEEGSLYPALHRLERRGEITSNWGQSENNRRARFYRVTPKGRRRLKAEVMVWQRLSEAVNRVLSRDRPAEGAGG